MAGCLGSQGRGHHSQVAHRNSSPGSPGCSQTQDSLGSGIPMTPLLTLSGFYCWSTVDMVPILLLFCLEFYWKDGGSLRKDDCSHGGNMMMG